MPGLPVKQCNYPGCRTLVCGQPRCERHWQHQERQRGSSAQRGYGYAWQQARERYLQANPLCIYCQRDGRLTAATVVDHIKPHRGDQTLFWDADNWQSLCATHHNSDKQRQEAAEGRGGIDSPGPYRF